ncbi:BON domain-containing protein [Oculatella sp. LEGE 06141]|uniref:BON domain-containing protein n=1 Tax=Oculatella sp. LEGE 06141 TaxID=1828648 RepID=UPI00188086D8|nr:BON domain-containing protein [Oculatella sp. LEGE 06141]
MGFLQRLFGVQKPQNRGAAQGQSANQGTAAAPQSTPQAASRSATQQQSVPPERVGLNGEYDDSGLAKRVALAFDEDSQIDDVDTVYVAQTGSTVVLKGKVPNRQLLDRMVSVAKGVNGAKSVETNQVSVG